VRERNALPAENDELSLAWLVPGRLQFSVHSVHVARGPCEKLGLLRRPDFAGLQENAEEIWEEIFARAKAVLRLGQDSAVGIFP
jgi:hypothetical protein